MELIIHTDGGSRGNPGEGAVGVVIEQIVNSPAKQDLASRDKPHIVTQFGKRIGVVTNNEAEYQAVIHALREIVLRITNYELAITKLSFFLDSLLVVSQLNGLWKIKQPHIRQLHIQVRSLEKEIGIPVTHSHVPREQNAEADLLVNQALDSG